MIESRNNEIVIVEGLEAYLSTETRPCKVVRQNQVAPIPNYPYVSYTVTSPVVSPKGGTYSTAPDGTHYRKLEQVWSLTVQSDDADEAMELAIEMFDFFALSGRVSLSDSGIIVHRVGGVTSRDNLVSIEYEHRCGLDVTFGLLHKVTNEGDNALDVIETAIETITFKEV